MGGAGAVVAAIGAPGTGGCGAEVANAADGGAGTGVLVAAEGGAFCADGVVGAGSGAVTVDSAAGGAGASVSGAGERFQWISKMRLAITTMTRVANRAVMHPARDFWRFMR